MFKKISALSLAVLMSLSLAGCSNKKSLSGKVITNKKAEITVYVPNGVKLDPRYYRDKDIAINYLPNDNKAFTNVDVDTIVNNIDKHVKVLIITTGKTGLESVFKKVKAKLPGVVTVSGDIGEMRNDDLYKVLKDPNINVSFTVEKYLNGVVSAKMAKIMKAKKFVYIYDSSKRESSLDIDRTRNYLKNNKIEFKAVKIDNNDISSNSIDSIIKENIGQDPSDTAVYPASSNLSKYVLDSCVEYKFIIPNLNSDDDGELMAKKFGILKSFKADNRDVFESNLAKKLKSYGLEGKIAGISESKESIPSEIAIEISKYMYEKNYMLEECYTDESLVDRGNRNLDLLIIPQNISKSYSYSRNLILSPRIY